MPIINEIDKIKLKTSFLRLFIGIPLNVIFETMAEKYNFKHEINAKSILLEDLFI